MTAVNSTASDTPKVVPMSGTLRVIAYPIEPFFYLDGKGQVAGFEYDILRSFAEANSMAIDIQWIEVLDQLIPWLRSGEGDVVAGTLTITPERQQKVDFSVPYFPARVVLVEREGQISTSLDSLRGKKVATLRGSTSERSLQEVPGIQLIYGLNDEVLFELVAAGEADALATDSAVYLWLARKFQGLEISLALSEKEFYGFVVRKGDPLKYKLDEHIDRLTRDGSYETYLRDAFGDLALAYIDSFAEEILEEEEP